MLCLNSAKASQHLENALTKTPISADVTTVNHDEV